ncbi:hypothetical protein LOZ53_001232 [Ophidiomyces ophidiicola]|uniref:Uncharacterized protein n=1 Tax=Ophidiomyces ophidiicola TaxID=1387563 RepID=A0ACB8UTT8_9EURO|nr:uncharacterized protein LOZ57_004435 [Ophidiomyces ophidiicola]KAI1915086.1 hypothetical protein LOZ64_003654 [Ophidiomyces ophidiicola]KAI1917772.1 hypothetical protein LOZ61_000392 [Ophidiomyces ophidiicola]KAI1922710.1 hypothetical protein LOZ60_005573 [Ophidiomyces ophidiicola]KAI1945137.1 hypothetical protein LOZ57_004435 [Ophidiomyces ophidiicola]KAI1946895.1 hypothetical protein LOZ62_003189 [Ophidiomyces ophidiicola]
MGLPRRKLLATVEETLVPPPALPEKHLIARVLRATGNNVYSVELPSKDSILVELPARFRSTIWMKRGSFVVIDSNALDERENKLSGQIVNIVRDEKAWRKASFWPKEFMRQAVPDGDDEDCNVGKMPPSDSDDA